MLLPPSIPSVPTPGTGRPTVKNEEPLTEDYGEPSENARTMGGGVDFFSSLGTEHRKKKPEKPNPDQVRPSKTSICCLCAHIYSLIPSLKSVILNSIKISKPVNLWTSMRPLLLPKPRSLAAQVLPGV
jgi:hypothetical protein